MRVLIIDTSRSIRESLLELLSSNDHKAEEASGSEDAIVSLRSFYPEVILLGSSVKGIQKILEAVNAEMIRLMKRPKIFMMVKKDTDVPLNVTPDGLIRKPFGSAEILDLLSANKEEEKEKRSLFKSLKAKKSSTARKNSDAEEMDVKFGRSYLFMEHEPLELRKACRHFIDKGEDILFITSGNVKAVKEMMRSNSVKVCAISEKEGDNYVNGSKIGSVTGVMTSFINSSKRPVVMLDDLRKLIQLNSLNSVLTMIDQTINISSGRTLTFLASLSPDDITERDKGLLMRNMIEYEIKR